VALVLLMVIAVIPFGAMAAIYLHEYARPGSRWTKAVRFAVSNLAGVPSIVFGLFGLGFFIQFLGVGMDRAMGLDVTWGQPCILWAALTLALLNLPVVIVTTEEALSSVPQHYREASLALGRHALADDLAGGAPAGPSGHPDRRHPGGRSRRGRSGTDPVHGGGLFPAVPAEPAHRPVHASGLSHVRPGHPIPDVDATRPVMFGTVLVLLALTLLLNLTATLIRARTRSRHRSG
jgi:phosphate transport system permease protein